MQLSHSQPDFTGSFVPKDQRTRVARETRRTHFTLGTVRAGYSTTQLQHFPAHATSPVSSGLQLARSTQQSHISLTDPVPSALHESEFRAKFPAYDVSQSAATLSEATKADLRRHHFQLGSSPGPLQSSTHHAFPPLSSSLPTASSIQLSAKRLKQHHFALGSGTLPLTSTAQATYTPKKADGWGKEEKLIQFRKDLRASHFKVGANPQSYVSLSRKDFDYKQFSARSPVKMTSEQHFELGTQDAPWQSTSQLSFTGRFEGRQSLERERLTDLRASHFSMGSSPVRYQPLSHESYAPQGPVNTEPADLDLRTSHFTLGSEERSWGTAYQTAHVEHANAQAVPQRDRNADKASHLTLGNAPVPMASHSSTVFQPHPHADPGQLDSALAADLRSHHFQLGSSAREFVPTSKDYAGAAAEPGAMDPALKSDLRTHHFTYGEDGGALVSRMQVDFQPPNGQPALLAADKKAELRRSHFAIGGDSTAFRDATEHRQEYRWVQPVPERLRYTFES